MTTSGALDELRRDARSYAPKPEKHLDVCGKYEQEKVLLDQVADINFWIRDQGQSKLLNIEPYSTWTDIGNDTIKSAKLDGTDIQTVVSSGLFRPLGIALDTSAGRMYWTDSDNDTIKSAKLDGTDIQTLVSSGLNYPEGIALDLDSGKMYFAEDNTSGEVCSANLDGSNVVVVVSDFDIGGGDARFVALDLSVTPVTLISFTAEMTDHVRIDWETAIEINSVGYHLWRSDRLHGIYTKITGFVIPTQGGPSWGAIYTWNDFQVDPDDIYYYYKLQEIVVNGATTMYGPVSSQKKE